MNVVAIARFVPLALTVLRAALAPVVVTLAIYFPAPSAFGACLISALLSDIFDGMIARRLKIATPSLRRLDSIVDTAFYLAASVAVWHLYPQAIIKRLLPLSALAFLEVARYGFDMAKFGRETSYHMWSSKLWGIALFAGFFCLLVLGKDNVVVSFMVYLGIVADVEGLAISLVLREWRADVPSIVHAMRQKKVARGRVADRGRVLIKSECPPCLEERT